MAATATTPVLRVLSPPAVAATRAGAGHPATPAGRPRGPRQRVRAGLESPWFPWAWTAVWGLAHVGQVGYSWHYVAQGARLLRAGGPDGGMHLYAVHPELQMGPLTFVVAGPLTQLPPALAAVLAVGLMAALGPVLLEAVARLPWLPVSARRRGLAALVLMPLWAEVAVHYGHLDDVLAMVLLVAAMHAVKRHRWLVAAVLLGASVDAKPWAVAFLPMLLALPLRDRGRALATWCLTVALAWLPFVLGDPRTLAAGRFAISNVATSSLRALGVASATTPWWDRPLQVVLGVGFGIVLVRRGRWYAVPAAVLAVRLLLDPGAYDYYTSTLVLATVVVDLVGRRTDWPWLSMLTVSGLYLDRRLGAWTMSAAGIGVTRLATLLALLLLLGLPGRRPRQRDPGTPAAGSRLSGTAQRGRSTVDPSAGGGWSWPGARGGTA